MYIVIKTQIEIATPFTRMLFGNWYTSYNYEEFYRKTGQIQFGQFEIFETLAARRNTKKTTRKPVI